MTISQKYFCTTLLLMFVAKPAIVQAFGEPTNFIEEGVACAASSACQNNDVSDYLNISGTSCNGEQACSDNTLNTFTVADGACSGPKSPEKPYGTCSSNPSAGGSFWAQGASSICSGASSCSNNTLGVNVGGDGNVCTGKHSCSDNFLAIGFTGEGDVCTGDDSCSFLAKGSGGEGADIQDLILGNQVCQGARSCRRSEGSAIIKDGACSGDDSCQNWKVGSVFGAYFSAGEGACSGVNSCQNIVVEQGIAIFNGSCTGANSCQNLTVEDGQMMYVYAGACTEENSCQNCQGRVNFEAGTQKCSDPEGYTSNARRGNVFVAGTTVPALLWSIFMSQ